MVAVMGLCAPKIRDQGLLEAWKSTKLLSSIQEVNVGQYIHITLACGVLETLILAQRDPEDLPGNYGTGSLDERYPTSCYEWIFKGWAVNHSSLRMLVREIHELHKGMNEHDIHKGISRDHDWSTHEREKGTKEEWAIHERGKELFRIEQLRIRLM
jgi:hypothetical protein